jgi:hypothetical protein
MIWARALLGVLLLSGAAQAEEGRKRSERCRKAHKEADELESQARALAVAEGCSEVSQCKSAAMGAATCGGPREYLPYCSLKTDEAELQKKLSRLAQIQEEFGGECGMASIICIFISEPALELVKGQCKKVTRR